MDNPGPVTRRAAGQSTQQLPLAKTTLPGQRAHGAKNTRVAAMSGHCIGLRSADWSR